MQYLGRIYLQPLSRIRTWILLLLLIWTAGRYFFGHKRWWRIANCAAAVASVYGILSFTVLHRSANSRETAMLIPFYSFIEAKMQPEKYREMLMNVFLFVPLGLSLPNVLPQPINKPMQPAWITVLTAFVLSAVIEFCQLYLRLGRCEVDDVIMNTLGAAVGTISVVLSCWIRKGYRK